MNVHVYLAALTPALSRANLVGVSNCFIDIPGLQPETVKNCDPEFLAMQGFCKTPTRLAPVGEGARSGPLLLSEKAGDVELILLAEWVQELCILLSHS